MEENKMRTSPKQVMDIQVSKGAGQSSNEQLRNWTEQGWQQAMKEGNYDRSREHLNFEIQKGGKIVPIDKSRSLSERMAANLATRGIKDPNEGLEEPKFRTVVNFIFGGSTDRMRELAFGTQQVDFESKSGNEHIRRMPEIEQWAKDIYDFVADRYGEENIVSFIVHLDEKNPHVHCSLLPIDKDNKFAFKKLFAGRNIVEFKQKSLALHDALAKVNEKWGLARGVSITESGARHRSTEDYRRWLANECATLEEKKENLQKALHDLNTELAIAERKKKSFSTMIENLSREKERLESELRPLRELQQHSDTVSQEIAERIQRLENQKADIEQKLADKQQKLADTQLAIDQLRQDKTELEAQADELTERARTSELDYAHSMTTHLNEAIASTMMSEFSARFPQMPESVRLMFDGTLLEEFASHGNHVATVALALMCEYTDQATTIAESHGGGGCGPTGGWRKKDDEDDRAFARRSLEMARQMCRPASRRKSR